mgnify:CR=1 FL=1
MIEITIPTVGESVKEANIGKLHIPEGAWANKGDVIFEIETDKASMEVSAPESGVVHYSINAGDLVKIAASVGKIDPSAKKPAPIANGNGASHEPKIAKATTAAAPPTAPSTQDLKGVGPAQRKAIREGKATAPTTTFNSMTTDGTDQERKTMSTLRKKIAERLLNSQQTTASLTTFNEVDMSNVITTRNQLKSSFETTHGVRLGFMSYFAKAVCYAAEQVPSVNAQIEGDEVVYNKNVHLSIAVSTERGLVVPVLRRVNQLSFSQIEKGIAELAERARLGKLGIEDMMGGTFTVTNGGVFGSMLSTPILNPPQSGILGMHKIENRPMAIEDGNGGFRVEVKPMMYVALTYDHRLIDGKESVTFLVKVKEFLETVKANQIS